MIGQTLGSYSIQRELGRGGMGAVYVGVHSLLGRNAAVKVLLPELSRNQDVVQRFFNEAKAATAIKHPGIVEIYDFGFSADGSAFIVMEFLEGESLATRLARLGRLPAGFALAVARQVATALAVAHKAGIVHRDLKPDNVFLVPDAEIALGERIKLLDFGIAKLGGNTVDSGVQRTSTGAIMGTPDYMSPEQCRGAGHVDARSDLYALGCMIYQMLSGRVPFVGEGAGDIIAAHLLLPPPPLRTIAPEVAPEIEALVMRLLAKSPAQRPESAEATAQLLAGLMPGLGIAVSGEHAAVAAPVETRAAASTTLGSAAGEEVSAAPPSRSRKGLAVGLGAVMVVGLAVGGVVILGGGGKTRAVDAAVFTAPAAAAKPPADAARPPADTAPPADAATPPADAAPPRGEPPATGALDQESFETAMRDARRRVATCGKKFPGVVGEVKVRLQIGPDGFVSDSTVVASVDPDLGECVLDVLDQVEFAETAKGGTFDYPYSFPIN